MRSSHFPDDNLCLFHSPTAPHLSTISFPALPASHIASNAFNSLVFQYVSEEGTRKLDWEVVPPEGAKKEGAAQTEVIEGEIKDIEEEIEENVPADKAKDAGER